MAKSPVIAAILSVMLPGVGHFYCGAWTRGLLVLFCSYFAFGAAALLGAVLGPVLSGLTILAIDALVAYDAWKTAKIEGALAAAEAAAPAEVAWIHWPWAALRAGWIAAFLVLFGGFGLQGVYYSLIAKDWFIAAACFLPTIFVFGLGGLAARSTWRVMSGVEAMPVRDARNEIGGTIFFGGIAVLMFMTVYPSFADLTRKSAEGAMKGHLGSLRDAFTRYRADHAENPPSLEAVAALTEYRKIPALWTTGRQPHKETRETIVLADGVPTDSGKWAYAVGTSTPIFVDCTHTDSSSRLWHAY